MVGDLVPLGAVIAPMALLATAIASVGVVVALTALGKTGIVHWGIIIAVVVLVLALILGNHNTGHAFGSDLAPEDKDALIAYLLSL